MPTTISPIPPSLVRIFRKYWDEEVKIQSKGEKMDKKIKSLQKDTKKIEKKESSLLKEDKKRDKFVTAGKKEMKKK